MEISAPLITIPFLVLGPFFYFAFYASDIFGLPKLSIAAYILGLSLGFTVWKPMLLITLALAWSVIIISWGMLIWGIVRQE